MDGRVDAHTHLYSALVPFGMPAPEPRPTTFLEILERVWWRLDRALDAASLRAAARLYAAESLLHGTSALVDHHESPSFVEGSLDVLADACQELGIRAVLCYGATERNGGRDEARRGLAECRRFLATNERPLVRGTIGIHAPFTVSDDTLREAGDLARELGTVLHLHVAEDATDGRDARERGYAGPIDRLERTGALVPGSILAHGVHLGADEVGRASAAGCWFVQNPRSNHGNGVGYPGALAASERVALGTDGYPADMVAEAEALLFAARANGEELHRAAARLNAGRELVAERFGDDPRARAEVSLGSITMGERAVVRGGRLVGHDLEELRAEARIQADALWSRLARL